MFTRLLKMLSGLIPNLMSRATAHHADCDTCNAFMAYRSDSTTCRRCSDARRVCHGSGPVKVNRIPGGVVIYLPLDCPVAPEAETPRTAVKLKAGQAEALSRILLKPGSASMSFGFDRNDGMLIVSWYAHGDAVVRITVWGSEKRDAALTLSAAQACHLGEDIAGCIGIIWTDAPDCDHDFASCVLKKFAAARGGIPESCQTCRHWSPDSDNRRGYCDPQKSYMSSRYPCRHWQRL